MQAGVTNWLSLIGMVFMFYAFGFVALAAVFRPHATDAALRRSMASRQRSALGFAGFTGMVGMALQIFGQLGTISEGAAALCVLSLVLVLLAFVLFSDRNAEIARTGRLDDAVPHASAVVTPLFGQAAE